MKKGLLIGFIAWIGSLSAFAQTEAIAPGELFSNYYQDTMLVISAPILRQLTIDATQNDINLERVKLYKKQLELQGQRSFLADSAISLQKAEAQYWHDKLNQVDEQLENQQLENLKLLDDKNRIRQSRIYYLVAGLLAGAVAVSL